MKTIIEIDLKDYSILSKKKTREASKVVIWDSDKILMLRSNKGDYKLIGGGIELGENPIDCLKREVLEETGYYLFENSIREVGLVHEVRKDAYEDFIFDMKTYLYTAKVDFGNRKSSKLTESEISQGFCLEAISPEEALKINKTKINVKPWVYRETKILEYIIKNMKVNK